MRPHYSHSNRDKSTPSSGTFPLAPTPPAPHLPRAVSVFYQQFYTVAWETISVSDSCWKVSHETLGQLCILKVNGDALKYKPAGCFQYNFEILHHQLSLLLQLKKVQNVFSVWIWADASSFIVATDKCVRAV